MYEFTICSSSRHSPIGWEYPICTLSPRLHFMLWKGTESAISEGRSLELAMQNPTICFQSMLMESPSSEYRSETKLRGESDSPEDKLRYDSIIPAALPSPV